MKKIFIPNIDINTVSIDKIKKRDKILVKAFNNIIGIVAIDSDNIEGDSFDIITFNCTYICKGKHYSLESLMKELTNYQFYLIEE